MNEPDVPPATPEPADPSASSGAEGLASSPASPPKTLRPLRGPGERPARPAPAAPPKGSPLKKYLMLFIIFATLALLGVNGYFIYVKFIHPPKKGARVDADEKWRELFDGARNAQKEIFSLEAKVWRDGKDLTADDLVAIREKLGLIQDSYQELKELRDGLHREKKDDSQAAADMTPKMTLVQLWILDADDLAEMEKKPPEYGGLYIPMYRALEKLKKARTELGEIDTRKRAGDPLDPEKTRKRVQELRGIFQESQETLGNLHDYIKKGLARDDLSPKVIVDLETLNEEAAQAGMANKQARELLKAMQE